MAGRPRTQFKNVDAIHSRAVKLHGDLDQLVPQMHKLHAGRGDALGAAWLAALDATSEARQKIRILRARLALRAGLGELEDLESEGGEIKLDASSNPTELDDVTETTLIWVDGDLMSLGRWAEMFRKPIPLILQRVQGGMDWEDAIICKIDNLTEHVDPTTDAIPAAHVEQE